MQKRLLDFIRKPVGRTVFLKREKELELVSLLADVIG